MLHGVRVDGQHSWKAYCPIHEDDGQQHDPSLQVTEANDGKVLVYCHVCKAPDIGPRICNKLGISIRALFPDFGLPHRSAGKKKRNIEGKKTAEYEYRDIDGVVQYKVMRYESSDGKKTFVQARPNGRGGWIHNMRGIRRIPYRLPELVATDKSECVCIAEGEKKVDALKTWGITATCNVGGAGKWNNEYAAYFRGRKVIILPDNDPIDPQTGKRVGIDHAIKVLTSLRNVAESVRILELPGLPEKGDIVDWQADGHTLAEFLELVAAVQSGQESIPDNEGSAPLQLDPISIITETGRTDLAAGKRFIEQSGQDMRWCAAQRKWYVWTGRRWAIDQMSAVDRWASECAEKLWQAIEDADVSADLKTKMKSWARHACSWSGLLAAINSAKSDPSIQVMAEKMDGNPWLFNCLNGTVDLRTGELNPHDRGDCLTKMSRVEYDPDAECPIWRKFVLSVFRQDQEIVDYVQRLCGYWATGVIREQILPIFWGSGANGKTTFLNAVMDVLGRDYTMKAPQDFLMAKYAESHPTEKADLFGKRFVACSETEEGRRLSESLVKEITGTERIRARRMREDFWEFDATHKVVLVTNHKPVVSGADHGIWRRIRLIEFGATFWDPDAGDDGPPEMRQDKELKDRLTLEYTGILRWILQGCQAWQRDGEQVPKSISQQTEEYKESQDVIGQWIEECCEVRSNASQRASELYKSFREWCQSSGEYIVSQKRFGASLGDRGYRKLRSADGWHYIGIELISSGYLV